MSRRKLSQVQTRRIENTQASRVQNLNKNPGANLDNLDLSEFNPEQPGRVMAHYGQTLEVQNQEGLIFKCFARQNLGLLVAGDRVLFCQSDQEGVITARLPRKSFLQRPDIHKGQKGIAANIDQIFLVIAVTPPPLEHALDRALVAAYNQDIPAILILNKTDLLEPNTPSFHYFKNLTQRYISMGYEALELGKNSNPDLKNKQNILGLENLLEKIKNKTSIFVGQSGVGKSSLINQIFDLQNITDQSAKTGDISNANQKGRHTTTTARLYQAKSLSLDIETCLVDSPGIREFGLWNLSPEELIQGFIEFKPFISQCQFRNCAHQENSKGCAIQKAVQEKKISRERLSSYFRLLTEIQNTK